VEANFVVGATTGSDAETGAEMATGAGAARGADTAAGAATTVKEIVANAAAINADNSLLINKLL
jgi:hypothetical protein